MEARLIQGILTVLSLSQLFYFLEFPVCLQMSYVVSVLKSNRKCAVV